MKIKYTNKPRKFLKITELISENTTYGVVYRTNNPKLVVKFIPVNNLEDIRGAELEYKVGSMMKSEHAVKSRYINYLRRKDIPRTNLMSHIRNNTPNETAYIVMDSLKQKKDEKEISVFRWINNFVMEKQACPGRYHPFYVKLRASLKSFYKLGYYHGDLHFGNIYVILDKNEKIKRVKLIDFGSVRKLNKNVSKHKCLKTILSSVQKEFKSSKSREPPQKFLGYPLKYNELGNPFRSNSNMLKNKFAEGFKKSYLYSSAFLTKKKK